MQGKTKNSVMFNGRSVSPDWPKKVAEAQRLKEYKVGGHRYKRVPHSDSTPCHDCAVYHGQLHVPGCDAEVCPKCGGQALGCGCMDDAEISIPVNEEMYAMYLNRIAKNPCYRCGHDKSILLGVHTQALVGLSSSLPVISIACARCGLVASHSTKLLDEKMRKKEENDG